MLVEGQIQSLCQFYFVFIFLEFNLFHRLSCIIILQEFRDLLWNQRCWYSTLLAVNLCKIPLFVEFQLRAIMQHNIIASADNAGFNRCEHHLLVAEMVADHGLGLGGECIYTDWLVVTGICSNVAGCQVANGNHQNHQSSFHKSHFLSQ